MAKQKGKKNGRKDEDEKTPWWQGTPYIALQYFLMKNKNYQRLSSTARDMYGYMRMQYKDYANLPANTDMSKIPFGPSCMPKISSKRYYNAMKGELIKRGFVKVVSEGGHGRKAIYDLTTMDWVDYEEEKA